MLNIFCFRKKRIGLALGGGAARGLANFGVIKALRQEKIDFHAVAGTSIGAVMACVWALNLDLKRVEKKIHNLITTHRDIIDIGISKVGFAKGKIIELSINEIIGNASFQNFQIPVAIVTTDLENGENTIASYAPKHFNLKGRWDRANQLKNIDLITLLKATCAIPGIYPPIKFEKKILVDGGIKENIPVQTLLKLGMDKVIAVDVGYYIKKGPLDNILSIFLQVIQVVGDQINSYDVSKADLVIKPNLKDIDQLAFTRGKDAIEQGYKAAMQNMDKIQRLMH